MNQASFPVRFCVLRLLTVAFAMLASGCTFTARLPELTVTNGFDYEQIKRAMDRALLHKGFLYQMESTTAYARYAFLPSLSPPRDPWVRWREGGMGTIVFLLRRPQPTISIVVVYRADESPRSFLNEIAADMAAALRADGLRVKVEIVERLMHPPP